MRVSRSASLVAIVCCGITAACSFDQQTIPTSTPDIVVHAVLDPGTGVQQVLVEQSLTGSVAISDKVKYDSLDPINTGGGIPVSLASVVISGPDGALVGLERKFTGKPASYGAGRYEVQAGVGRTPIRPGATYTLTVKTLDGAVVTGKTVVPSSAPSTFMAQVNPFDRERDTLHISWTAVQKARSYGLRVETPFGAFMLFSDSTHVELPGTLRNFLASDLQRVFIPGFQQVATIVAVDTNYFDYYRSRNDPFTGSGLISHLSGGIGLFGSVVTVDSRNIVVTQPTTDPTFEGVYDYISGPPLTTKLVDQFQLFIESGTTAKASLSGSYTRNRATSARDAVAGTRDGSRIQLDFLQNQDMKTAIARFTGAQVGDSLVGAYTGSNVPVVFRRRLTP
jgi:hypothetical protein